MEEPWVMSRTFAVDAAALAIIACATAGISYVYMKIVNDVTENWLEAAGSPGFPRSPESIKLMNGAPLWVPLCWAGGTFVGLLKALLNLDQPPSFLEDLLKQEVEPWMAAKTVLCCVPSLVSGAAMGPEAGLAAVGGALGTLLSRAVSSRGRPELEEARRPLYVLAGMAAAFGTILPAPWVALLIVLELSSRKADEAGTTMVSMGRRTLFLLGFAASMAYAVRYRIEPIENPPLPGIVLEKDYDNSMPLKALCLGLGASVVALVYFAVAGICKRLFGCLSTAIERRAGFRVRVVILASLAGLLTGLVGFCVPLALTDGASQIMPTINSCRAGHLSTWDLVVVALAKCFAYWIASSGGLVGGIFFPLIYVGLVVGEIASKIPGLSVDYGPAAFTVPVLLASLPSAIVPAPFTMVAFPLSMFNLGPKWCVPVFIGVLTSYTSLVGTGLLRRLLLKAAS
mmetsp:Transcript_10236/g.31560  ORF Transcript_10236/g.31560 Transcript_10236/m.31560 type:complete len:456 (+) Transcript_10236:956-2323(+)